MSITDECGRQPSYAQVSSLSPPGAPRVLGLTRSHTLSSGADRKLIWRFLKRRLLDTWRTRKRSSRPAISEVDQLGAKSDFIDGCCAPATSGRVFLFQQGLAIDEMGFGGQLHGSNFEPLMSALCGRLECVQVTQIKSLIAKRWSKAKSRE